MKPLRDEFFAAWEADFLSTHVFSTEPFFLDELNGWFVGIEALDGRWLKLSPKLAKDFAKIGLQNISLRETETSTDASTLTLKGRYGDILQAAKRCRALRRNTTKPKGNGG